MTFFLLFNSEETCERTECFLQASTYTKHKN